MKLLVVPEPSPRLTGVTARSGQLDALVQRGDRRVVPLLDLLVEQVGDDAGRQLQLVDALEVVDDGDGADVERELDDVAALAAGLAGGDLLVLERRVGAGERQPAGQELLPAAARAHRVVVDRDVGVGLGEAGAPGLHRGLLGAGAATVQGAAELRGGAGVGDRLVVGGATARGEREGAGGEQGREAAVALDLHSRGSRSRCLGAGPGPEQAAAVHRRTGWDAREPR